MHTPAISRKIPPAALLILLLAAVAWFGYRERQTKMESASPNLSGAAATRRLKEQGLYDSLRDAVRLAPYQIRRASESNRYEARNPAQQFSASFTPESLQLQTGGESHASWRMSLRLRRVGAVEVSPGEIETEQNRVEIRHRFQISNLRSEITEWYRNTPAGLEHGFTLATRPEGEKLRLVMALDGDLKAEAAADGRSIALHARSGEQALYYSGLVVTDAAGRRLPGRLTAKDDELAIEVDDAGAVYPVLIDPTFFQPQKLAPDDIEGFDFFGAAVALSGDTAIIGTAGNDANGNYGQGAAYVYIRTGSTWTLQQKLVAGDGAANDSFGRSVAIDGDTALVGASADDIGAATDRGSA